MKKALFAAAVCCVLLSGCQADAGDSLFQAPRLPGDYVALQASLDGIAASGAVSVAPDSGSNRHSVQLVDIDADGTEEVISFFRNAPGGTQFSVYMHKKNSKGDYAIIGSITGTGTGITQVYYPRRSENGECAVCVLFGSGEDASGTLITGCVNDGSFYRVMEASCTDIYVGNVNQNSDDEIILIQKGGDVSQFSAKLYYFDGNSINSMPSVSLSAGIKGIAKIRKSNTSDGVPAVFIDSVSSGKGYLTDVLAYKNDTFGNITLDPTSGTSGSTYRQVSMPSSDIAGSGIYSIPLAYPMPGNSGASEIQWRLEWNTVASNGALTPVTTTYHNVSEEWYITFPDKWDDKITVTKSTVSGAGVTTFCYCDSSGQIVPLFSLYSASEDEKQDFENQPQYICIGAGSSKSYYITMCEQGKDSKYYLEEDQIRTVFNIIPKVWASEVYGS